MTADEYGVAEWAGPSMGGTLAVAICADAAALEDAQRVAARVGQRVNAWARRLTRFDDRSELSRLNSAGAPTVDVGPTLGSVLSWAQQACTGASGVIDVTLLDARLAAEDGGDAATASRSAADRRWSLWTHGRRAQVDRRPGTRLDLDGVAKGWLADRAADLLWRWPGSYVDADGDISLAVDQHIEWLIDVVDPRPASSAPLATLRFAGTAAWRRVVGIATSGTSVHRWPSRAGSASHHLIDPRTGRPAVTDVAQCTVVAPTAREAEVLAKAAVILGSTAGISFLERSPAHAAVLLLETGEVATIPGTRAWLA